jgi:Zn-dependent protease
MIAAISWTREDIGIIAGVVVLLLVSNGMHEAGHAVVAWWAGDRRDSIRARMTLNPLKHVSLLLTVVLPILSYWLISFPFGGAKPVMVDAGRIGPRKMALVALAGPFGNLLFAVLAAIVMALLTVWGYLSDIHPVTDPDIFKRVLFKVLDLSIWFSVTLVALNLIPLPPADGSRVLAMFMPERMRAIYYAMAPVTVVILVIFVMWLSGYLHAQLHWVPKGHPEIFAKSNRWVQDRVDDLVGVFTRLGGK